MKKIMQSRIWRIVSAVVIGAVLMAVDMRAFWLVAFVFLFEVLDEMREFIKANSVVLSVQLATLQKQSGIYRRDVDEILARMRKHALSDDEYNFAYAMVDHHLPGHKDFENQMDSVKG